MTDPILLPSTPALKTDTPTMLDWGGALTPPNGGPTQNLMRLGTRHSLDFTLPLMPTEPDGRIWAAKLRLAKLYGALLPFGQDGLNIGAPGAPLVDGGGQAGTILVLRGFRPWYVVRIGRAFSLVHEGRRYLHFAADQGFAGADGSLTLDIFPMLRVIPDDADVCEFGKPMIQGSLTGNKVAYDRLTEPWTDLGKITITEDE